MNWQFLTSRAFLVSTGAYTIIFVLFDVVCASTIRWEAVFSAIMISIFTYLVAFGYLRWMRIFAGGLIAWRVLLTLFLLGLLGASVHERLPEQAYVVLL